MKGNVHMEVRKTTLPLLGIIEGRQNKVDELLLVSGAFKFIFFLMK